VVIKQDSNKQIVAWFKIAEFVSRGEKERALALYRLLAHAINDPAFAQQLEGDILLSFNDEHAFERYAQAVQLYCKSGKVSEAAAVYEHLLVLTPRSTERLQMVVDLYLQFPKQQRTFDALQHFIRLMINQHEFEKVSALLQQLPGDFGVVHQELVNQWAIVENAPAEPLKNHVHTIIDYYYEVKQHKALQTFLMTLKMMHRNLYEDACFYLQDKPNIN
jgi:tetratricopeptide (TPR) repeat protein